MSSAELAMPTGLVWMAIAISLSAGCPNKDTKKSPDLLDDASFGPRVFNPPPSDPVRAVPPHNIHSGGVGPYELSASLQSTLALLPNGPRVELFEAKGLFDYRLMRSDGDALLLGVGRRGGVAFISVLDPDIARTESGVGVGAGVKELTGALGMLKAPRNQGRDARIITFTALPNTRFIVEDGKVVAAVLTAEGSTEPEAESTPCDVAKLGGQDTLLTLAMGLAAQGPASASTACLVSAQPGVILRHGDLIAWGALDAQGELRVQPSTPVAGLRFVTTLQTGGVHPALYSVSERRSAKLREVIVTRYQLVGGRFVADWSRVAFSLEAKTASWIGARLQTADFLVELTGHDSFITVGGIYMERNGGLLRHVVPVKPIELRAGNPIPKPRAANVTELDAGKLDVANLDAGKLDAGKLDASKLDAGRLDAAPAKPID